MTAFFNHNLFLIFNTPPPTILCSCICDCTVYHSEPSNKCSGQHGSMEHRACLHLCVDPGDERVPHLETSGESHEGVVYGETSFKQFCSKQKLEKSRILTFSLSPGALAPSSAFTEHFHQCLPDGAVRGWHVDTIRCLDVNRYDDGLKGLYPAACWNVVTLGLLSAGLLIYFAYGVRNSVQRKRFTTDHTKIGTVSSKTDKDIIKEERFWAQSGVRW